MEKNIIELQEINNNYNYNISDDLKDKTSLTKNEGMKESSLAPETSSKNQINPLNTKNSETLIELQNLNQKNDDIKFKKLSNVENNQEQKNEKKASIFTSMPNCLKNIDLLRERKLSVQVGIVYTVFMIIFIISIGLAKIIQINSLLETQADKNYYTSIVSDMIDIQREVKAQLDEVNNDDYTSSMFNSLLFFEIYTQELINHGLIDVDNAGTTFAHKDTEFPTGEEMYKSVSDSFVLSSKLSELMDDYPAGKTIFLNNALPFYFNLMPIFYQNLKIQGIPVINSYFIGYDYDCTNMMYFKYPLEQPEVETSTKPRNNAPFDFILDPVGECSLKNIKGIDDSATNKLQEKVKDANWFYNFEKTNILNNSLGDKTSSSMLTLLKVTQDNRREEYFVNLVTFKTTRNSKDFYFTFSLKMFRNEMEWPYVILDENKDISKFNYLSLLNIGSPQQQVKIDKNDGVYLNDYNIDDYKTIVVNLPKFIDNIYKYTMIPKELTTKESSINVNSLMLKYSEMEEIKDNYTINYFYNHDTNFFKLVVFLNNFFNYFLNNPGNVKEESKDFHPCVITDIEEYISNIAQFIDCMKDYCFYNTCTMKSELYYEPEKTNFMPNCYCLPLYCRDHFSTNNAFHKNITKKLGLDESSNDYAYTSKKVEDNANIYYNNLLHEYYNNETNQFKCKISFIQKREGKNETFNTKIMMKKLSYDSNTSMMVMFLMTNDEIHNIIETFKNLVSDIKWIIYLVYFLFLTIVAVFLIAYLIHQVNKLTDRMNKMKEIRTKIISGNNTNENKERSSLKLNPEEKKENDVLLDKEERSKSIDLNLNAEINEHEQKEENKIEEDENDELSALKTLIYDNINDFKIEFNINENMNDNINLIERQYNEIIKVNGYKNKLLPNTLKAIEQEELIKKEEEDMFMKEEDSLISTSNIVKVKEQKETAPLIDDLSLKIFYELLSLSTSEVDFSKTKTNFYFKDDFSKSILNFEDIINSIESKDNSNTSEITNQEKLENAISYYKEKIHKYWKDQYDNQKKKEEI